MSYLARCCTSLRVVISLRDKDFFLNQLSGNFLKGVQCSQHRLASNQNRGKYGHRNRPKMTHKGKGQSSSAWLRRQDKDPYAARARDEGLPSRSFYKLEQIDKGSNRRGRNRGSPGGAGRIIRMGQSIVDLGAAPGGWSIYASQIIGLSGTLIAVDLLSLDPATNTRLSRENPSGFHSLQGDFRTMEVKEKIMRALLLSKKRDKSSCDTGDRIKEGGHSASDAMPFCEYVVFPNVDVVMSDMAATFTGDRMTDALRTMALCEEALMFAAGVHCFEDENVLSKSQAGPQPPPRDDGWQDRGLLSVGGTFLCKFFSCGRDNEDDLMRAARWSFEDVTVLKPKASRKESAEQYLLATGYRGR